MASVSFGYTLSSEEHDPATLVENAGLAERAGFDFLSISDHFHPWIDRQGHSPFVWGVIGGIASTTDRIRLSTGVTCPTIRIHPAIIAHAAATAACLMPGRFTLGLGTGENLNEHILGQRWPEYEVRVEQLTEAVDVIRALWSGEITSHHGRHYTVENTRIYDVPDPLPQIVIAAGGPRSAEVAARIGEGLYVSSPEQETIEAYRDAGGDGPVFGQVGVCWDPSREDAIRTVHEIWPTGSIPGESSQELPMPAQFEALASLVTPEQVAESFACGPDVGKILEAVQEALDAGVTNVYLHQIGPRQAEFLRIAEQELLPELRTRAGTRQPAGAGTH
jgi:G6PDH family F420-dependent oxidoreductase